MRKPKVSYATGLDLTFVPTDTLLKELANRSRAAIGILIIQDNNNCIPYVLKNAYSWEIAGLLDMLEMQLADSQVEDDGETASEK